MQISPVVKPRSGKPIKIIFSLIYQVTKKALMESDKCKSGSFPPNAKLTEVASGLLCNFTAVIMKVTQNVGEHVRNKCIFPKAI